MKKLLPILFVLIITSCSKEVPSDQLVIRDGIFYEVNSQTPFSGTSLSYNNDGQLEYREHFKDGKVDGLVEEYHENGQLKVRTNYKDGKRDGLRETFDVNGNPVSKGNYTDGELDGYGFIEK